MQLPQSGDKALDWANVPGALAVCAQDDNAPANSGDVSIASCP